MPNIDISVAVATESGLITPIVTDVPNKTLPQISADIKALAAKAREGKLQLHEFQVSPITFQFRRYALYIGESCSLAVH